MFITGPVRTLFPTYTYTFTSNVDNPDLRTLMISAGWNGSRAAILNFVVNAGVVIGSTSISTSAFVIDSADFPTNCELNLTIAATAYITGKGGNGGAAGAFGAGNGSNGQNGGNAIETNRALNVDNSGTVQGGGGGGGGGAGGPTYSNGGGGGGGAGDDVGVGGNDTTGGGNGDWGTLTAGGAGTSSIAINNGGNGGNPGANGNNGVSDAPYTGGTGGSGGDYAVGNSNITWISAGTRLGGTS